MPSPFPGMDPYLEGALWTTVHFSLSAEIVRQLAPKLRPRYLILPVERFVTETPESVAVSTANIYPDVSVAETRSVAGTTQGTVIAPAPLELPTIIPTPIPHVTLEIRDTAHRQLVTAIEVLSPTNKRGGIKLSKSHGGVRYTIRPCTAPRWEPVRASIPQHNSRQCMSASKCSRTPGPTFGMHNKSTTAVMNLQGGEICTSSGFWREHPLGGCR